MSGGGGGGGGEKQDVCDDENPNSAGESAASMQRKRALRGRRVCVCVRGGGRHILKTNRHCHTEA